MEITKRKLEVKQAREQANILNNHDDKIDYNF